MPLFWVGGWVGGWVDGWMEGEPVVGMRCCGFCMGGEIEEEEEEEEEEDVPFHLEHAAKLGEGEGVVKGGEGEEIGPQALRLDLLQKHGLDFLHSAGTGDAVPDLRFEDLAGR